MSFTRWLRNLQSFCHLDTTTWKSRRAARSAPAKRARLQLETLEDRIVPSFSPVASYSAGANPQAVRTADFNGDGRLDLAVANNGDDSVSVLLGNADGTFQPARKFATGSGPQSLAVGDFNGDGKLDLVTANKSQRFPMSGDLSVLLGNGDGTFGPATTVAPASNGTPTSVAVGDLNSDGKLDLVVTSYFLTGGGPYVGYSTTTQVNVLLGNGNGTFAAPFSYDQGGVYSTSPAVGDFNHDGKLDVVTANDNGSISMFLGNGDGTLQSATVTFTGMNSSITSLAVGDLNGDGKLDVATANGGSNNVSVLLGNGNGAFLPAQNFATGASPQSMAVADFNGDGKLDLVTANQGLYPAYSGSASVLLGNGNGTFQAALNYATGTDSYSVAVGDFNGDRSPDLAVANAGSNNLSVLLNAGNWSSTPAQASSFVVSGFPSTTTAGVAGNFTVTAKKADGTTATAYTGIVHFSSSDGQAGLPANYTFTAADNGVHTFSATLKTSGTQSFTATDFGTASLTGSETGITVNPAAASQLRVSAPAGSTAGSAFSIVLTALDPYNNTATGYTGAVHFTSSDGQAILPSNYTFTAADNGVHPFSSGVILKAAGTQTVTASDTVTSAITGSAPVTINAAAASTMTVTGFPSSTTAGAAGGLTVTLKDIYGNTASGYTGTVHISSSDGNAALPANYTFTAADAGVHTFSVILKTAGAQSLTVADTTTASLTGTDGGITVNAAAASQFIISAPSTVTSGAAFSLTITVEDAYGNVVTGYTGTIHFTSSDRTATLPADYTFTAADKGVHTFTGLVLRKKGTQKITITDTMNSSLTGGVYENVL